MSNPAQRPRSSPSPAARPAWAARSPCYSLRKGQSPPSPTFKAAALDSLKAEIEAAGVTALTCVTGVRDEAQVAAWIADSIAAFGRLDGAVNLAAVIGRDVLRKATEDITTEDWNFVIGVNLTGMMNSLRTQIPHLKSGAAIVVVTSISGTRGFPMNGAYCASKHGVIGLSRCTAKELGLKGIRLNIVAPGPVDTPMMQQSDSIRDATPDMDFLNALALRRMGKPHEVADLIEFLLSEKSSFMTGAVVNIDGGWM
ncbi:3-alpha--hydroxysteroid dehydrogenase [Trichodelitschia bisporula]|uniref:3-alpha--hydroxysteroid dehydrogenase n=1 Tax=Trichodelitschia bisporula TaxID=703511 RepID=A0A6G1I047_9PEZI|nr:3-alpha--hydroxysteroid dehydrogenase [Trichodelitschia bisporula]